MTPIHELIEGLDEVGSFEIPYARLPARARTAYSAEFVRWSDIAGESERSLLSRPKAGRATVRALLSAAEDAVAANRRARASGDQIAVPEAVERALGELARRDRMLLSARVWPDQPRSLPVVAAKLGVSPSWVQRNLPRARAAFAELLTNPVHATIARRAVDLGASLGSYAPARFVDDELGRIGVNPGSEAARVLLYLAGPYTSRGGWFENARAHGRDNAAAAVDAVFERCSSTSTEVLSEALVSAGMVPEVVAAYLDSEAGLRRMGDVWIPWTGTLADKVAAALEVLASPAVPESIADAFAGEVSLRAIQDALYADDRFVRTSRTTWGLRADGIRTYTGIFDEVATRVDAAGGSIAISDLVDDVMASVPDIDEQSIRLSLNTLAFVTEGALVRRRTDDDEFPPVEPLCTVRGAFRNGDNEIRLAITVTDEMVRGSSRPISPSVAAAVGVAPGTRRAFRGPYGDIAVVWRLSSTNGPNIGSVRPLALATDAVPGDTLVLAFRLDGASVSVERIGAHVTSVDRLALLLGGPVTDVGTALAASVDCPRDILEQTLRDRGDGDLADLID